MRHNYVEISEKRGNRIIGRRKSMLSIQRNKMILKRKAADGNKIFDRNKIEHECFIFHEFRK